jgi:hypothetical protein
MAIYSFKTQQSSHGNRLQNIEEKFASGMNYTNTPLIEGSLKTLVNYDIHDSGASLVPRPGLKVTRAFTGTCAKTEQIIAAKEQYIEEKTWGQFFTKGVLPAGNRYVTAALSMLYGDHASVGGDPFQTAVNNSFQKISYDNATYNIPQNAEIHGMTINDPSRMMVRHIGVDGWNGNYYFFDSVLRKVVHTEWDVDTSAYKFATDDPKVITSKEAVSWGYNMLQEYPYTFADQEGAANSVIQFTGMLPYDAADELCLAPVINQTINFRVFYQVEPGKKYRIVWEWRSASGQIWSTINDSTITFTSPLAAIYMPFSAPEQGVILRVSAYGYTGDVVNTYTDATLAVGFSFNKEEYGSTANVQPKTYSVVEAKGMTYWNNRLVCWGVPEDPTMLFVSDVNDPTYFPYPNNVDTFDEPIRYAIKFLDYLLVFTSTKLFLLTLSSDSLGWTTQCIQNNLAINDWDVHLIQVVKNMVFFRSGNYYYMIVPSASSNGNLSLAPVSKPMKYFFDHFEDSVKTILRDTYEYEGSLTLLHYYNYLDFEDVHNVYVFKTDDNELINFCVLYNTVDRSWRIYAIGSQNIMIPYKADATQRGTLCGAGSDGTNIIPQLLRYDTKNNTDFYIPNDTSPATVLDDFTTIHKYKNWQYLDTGYREHSSNFKKRYREIQFVINNISNLPLKFYSDFYIDGETRKDHHVYSVVQELDSSSPNYGTITVERTFADPLTTPAVSVLAEDQNDELGWELGVAMFPEVSFWKARQLVSGKGYTPRFLLISQNEAMYELLNISWVYRALYSR